MRDDFVEATSNFQPRTFGNIPQNSSCILFGWGQADANPRREAINVFSPRFCNPNLQQAFCSRFDDNQPPGTCTAILGSPLTCGDESIVRGFLVGSNGECERRDNLFELNFHSIDEFQGWINQVSGSQKAGKFSFIFVLSAIFVSLRNMTKFP